MWNSKGEYIDTVDDRMHRGFTRRGKIRRL